MLLTFRNVRCVDLKNNMLRKCTKKNSLKSEKYCCLAWASLKEKNSLKNAKKNENIYTIYDRFVLRAM